MRELEKADPHEDSLTVASKASLTDSSHRIMLSRRVVSISHAEEVAKLLGGYDYRCGREAAHTHTHTYTRLAVSSSSDLTTSSPQ
jgi:hypothetical protein